jgi:hypothetical protein
MVWTGAGTAVPSTSLKNGELGGWSIRVKAEDGGLKAAATQDGASGPHRIFWLNFERLVKAGRLFNKE